MRRLIFLVILCLPLLLSGCGVNDTGLWLGESSRGIEQRAWAETQGKLNAEATRVTVEANIALRQQAERELDRLAWREAERNLWSVFSTVIAAVLFVLGGAFCAMLVAQALTTYSQREFLILRPDKRGILPALALPPGYTVVYPPGMLQEARVHTGVLPRAADQRIQIAASVPNADNILEVNS